MRLATMITPRGPRLHVKGRTGYVDVGDATGDPVLATLRGLLGIGAMDSVRDLADRDGADFGPADFGPAVPEPRRVLCLGVNYREHAIEGGRDVPTWPEAFVRGEGSAIGPYADLVRPALTGPGSCPAASARCWPWAGCSCSRPTCSCSTSRPRTSRRSSPARC